MCVLCPQEWHHGRSIWYFILDCFGSALSDGIAGIAEFGWMDILAVMAHIHTKASQQLVLVVSATVHSALSFSFRQSSTTHSTMFGQLLTVIIHSVYACVNRILLNLSWWYIGQKNKYYYVNFTTTSTYL